MKTWALATLAVAIVVASTPSVWGASNSATRPVARAPRPPAPKSAGEASQAGAAPQSQRIAADVLLVQDVDPWDYNSNEIALAEAGLSYVRIASWQLPSADLSSVGCVMYGSDQPTSYYENISLAVEKVSEFVASGGILVAHVCDGGWSEGYWSGLSVLPGNVQHVLEYLEDVFIADPSHPVVDGLTDSYLSGWFYSSHGYFTDLPAGSRVVIQSAGGQPTYVEYGWGSGMVIVTLHTIEWGYGDGYHYQLVFRPDFLRNELAYVRDIGGLGTSVVTSGSYPSEDEWTSTTWYRHIGQFHAHYNPDIGSRRPGEPQSATDLLGMYRGHGYDFLAATEHHQKLESDKDNIFTHAEPTGIVSMKGALEDSHQNDTVIPTGSHILAVAFDQPADWNTFWPTLGSAPTGDSEADRLARLDNIHGQGGLAFVPHPDSRFYHWPEWMLHDLAGHYEGIELYNRGAGVSAFSVGWTEGGLLGALIAEHADAFADDTWDELLRDGIRDVWGTAGDDYHPDFLSRDSFDTTSVVVWTQSETSDETQIKDALRAGRFYATKGGSHAPIILAYWADPATRTVSAQVPQEKANENHYRVAFVRGRSGRPPVDGTLTSRGDGTYIASYTYNPDDLYVRTEVRDSRGNTSWLQPVWIDELESKTGQTQAGQVAAAALEPVILVMAGATLEVSMPQVSFVELTGSLVPGDQRPPAPPAGYLTRCYSFTPEADLQGTNPLTIAYFPDLVRGFPADSLAIYRYDQVAGAWGRLDSLVDEATATATANITRFGIYTVSAELPQDTDAPSLWITWPYDGDTVWDLTAVTAETYDDQGVVSVHFCLDGWPLGTDEWGGDGWAATLDPANYTAGERVLSAVAGDGAGNETSTEITVNIAGFMAAPAITISDPAEAEVVWGDLRASGSWSGELPMSLGVFTIDNQPLTIIPGVDDSWHLDVPIPTELAGDRTFTASGFDIYGNPAEAAVSITLKVFADMALDFWARDHIYATARNGIVKGYPDGAYHPEYPVTRDQMAVYIARAMAGGDANVPDPGCSAPVFTDVDCEQWARKYIQYAVSQGVVRGYPEGDYKPGLEVTRDQMAVYVARSIATPRGEAGLADYAPADPRNFPDVPADFWAWRHVEYCVEQGVVNGYDDGDYHPEIVVTRDQMAVYVARAFLGPWTVDVSAAIQGPAEGMLAADMLLKFYRSGGSSEPVETTWVSLDGDGRGAVSLSLPRGNYDVWGKVPTHLARRVNGCALPAAGSAVLDFGTLLGGDLVNDNVIGQADFDYMNSVWSTDDPIADINRDGIVNTIDFAILNGNWGKTGDQ